MMRLVFPTALADDNSMSPAGKLGAGCDLQESSSRIQPGSLGNIGAMPGHMWYSPRSERKETTVLSVQDPETGGEFDTEEGQIQAAQSMFRVGCFNFG